MYPITNQHLAQVKPRLDVNEVTRTATHQIDLMEYAKQGSGITGLIVGGCAALFILIVFAILFWV